MVKLQSGDEYCLTMWRKLVDITMAQCQHTYDRLNVTLTRDDTMGESLYNPMLPSIVQTLKDKGLAVEDDGAVVVFWMNLQIKQATQWASSSKKDGGYLYTTTDIAAAATAIIHFMLTVSFCLPMHAKPYMHSKHGSSHARQDLYLMNLSWSILPLV